MAVSVLFPATAAAVFTVGCVLIHTQRKRPERATRVLVSVALLVLFGFVIHWTGNSAAVAQAIADVGDPFGID